MVEVRFAKILNPKSKSQVAENSGREQCPSDKSMSFYPKASGKKGCVAIPDVAGVVPVKVVIAIVVIVVGVTSVPSLYPLLPWTVDELPALSQKPRCAPQ